MSRVYKTKYTIECGVFSRKQLEADGAGGCDELLACSVLNHEDGSGSYLWISSNGKTGQEMSADRKLKTLTILAKELSDDPAIGPGAQEFCRFIFESYRQAILRS